MHVLGNLTQYQVSQFINEFISKRKNRNMVWFGNLDDGMWFVNKTSSILRLKRLAARWNNVASMWIVSNILQDGTILDDIINIYKRSGTHWKCYI